MRALLDSVHNGLPTVRARTVLYCGNTMLCDCPNATVLGRALRKGSHRFDDRNAADQRDVLLFARRLGYWHFGNFAIRLAHYRVPSTQEMLATYLGVPTPPTRSRFWRGKPRLRASLSIARRLIRRGVSRLVSDDVR